MGKEDPVKKTGGPGEEPCAGENQRAENKGMFLSVFLHRAPPLTLIQYIPPGRAIFLLTNIPAGGIVRV